MGLLAWRARQVGLAYRVHRCCRPQALREVQRWAAAAGAVPDPNLRRQAQASLARKCFHCEGGAVYAELAPGPRTLIPGICALQTLVDYLDNLSDRCGVQPEATLRRLHLAVDDALTPGAPVRDYYGPGTTGDGGYLAQLVQTTQACLGALPGYRTDLQDRVRRLGGLYADLQVYKHLPGRHNREARLIAWLEPMLAIHPGWQWWELAAACGSTLGIFALLGAAAQPGGEAWAPALTRAYFPWVGGLHILLDYYVDQAEDAAGGDLNLVSYYGGPPAATAGLGRILAGALSQARTLPRGELHELVVTGLPGLYLSDPKVRQQGLGLYAAQLLRAGGPMTLAAWCYCRLRPPGR